MNYFSTFDTIFITVLIFFGGIIAYGIGLAANVKENTKSIYWLELKDLNAQILNYQMMYKCSPPEDCLIIIKSDTDREALRKFLDDKDILLDKLGLQKKEK